MSYPANRTLAIVIGLAVLGVTGTSLRLLSSAQPPIASASIVRMARNLAHNRGFLRRRATVADNRDPCRSEDRRRRDGHLRVPAAGQRSVARRCS